MAKATKTTNESHSELNTEEIIANLTAERDFLLARASEAGGISFGSDRWTGRSSNALVDYAITGNKPEASYYPSDPSDYMACERTYNRLPEHLKPKVEALVKEYEQVIEKKYPGWRKKEKKNEVHAGMPINEAIKHLETGSLG